MGIAGAKWLKLYDDVTDTYVDIRLISKDSSYEKSGLYDRDLNGNLVWYEDAARLFIAFYDGEKAAQMETWQRNHTPLKVVVIGNDDYIFWDTPSTIVLTEPGDFDFRRRNVRTFEMRSQGDDLDISRQAGFVIEIENFVGYYNTTGDPVLMNLLPATFTDAGPYTYSADGQDFNFNTAILDDGN